MNNFLELTIIHKLYIFIHHSDKDPDSSFSFLIYSKYPYMMVTASNIPVPDPITPKKSAIMVNAPMHIPPNAAATGIYLPNSFLNPVSLKP